MAFRIEAAVIVVFAQSLFGAVEVEHRHLHGGSPGMLEVTDQGIEYTEISKTAKHNRRWKYEEIQQLELSDSSLRILTYEPHNREFVFDRLPKGFADRVYPMWKDKLDQRFVAGVADPDVKTLEEFRVKGGTLLFGEDRIVLRGKESRTWRFSDIENIASAGPFDLSIVTFERHGLWKAEGREFRFQLQRPMEEARFNDLWRRVTRVR